MGFVDLLGSIDWEHESYPKYEDFIVLPLFALFFPTVRFFLDRFIFEVPFRFIYVFCSTGSFIVARFIMFLDVRSNGQAYFLMFCLSIVLLTYNVYIGLIWSEFWD